MIRQGNLTTVLALLLCPGFSAFCMTPLTESLLKLLVNAASEVEHQQMLKISKDIHLTRFTYFNQHDRNRSVNLFA